MILNLTLLFWSNGFSLLSGGSTNLNTANQVTIPEVKHTYIEHLKIDSS